MSVHRQPWAWTRRTGQGGTERAKHLLPVELQSPVSTEKKDELDGRARAVLGTWILSVTPRQKAAAGLLNTPLESNF